MSDVLSLTIREINKLTAEVSGIVEAEQRKPGEGSFIPDPEE